MEIRANKFEMSDFKMECKMSEAVNEKRRVRVGGLKWKRLEVIVLAWDHYDSAS